MNHFREETRATQIADVNRRKWFIAAREHKERKEQIEERAEAAFLDFAAAVVSATEIEIEVFQTKLTSYEEATVVALMENRQALDIVQAQLISMLERAHVLEDGRRVFKTKDGVQVFDEDGELVNEAIIHPDSISDECPTWEEYQPIHLEQKRLMQEREGMIEYQEKLDAARERSSADDFTKEELDDLDIELADAMPPAVKKHIPGIEISGTIERKTEFETSANSVMKPSM